MFLIKLLILASLITFLISEYLFYNFITLVILLIMLFFVFYTLFPMNWTLFLMIIVIMSGLFIIFFYIVSIDPELPPHNKSYSWLPIFTIFISIFPLYIYWFFPMFDMSKDLMGMGTSNILILSSYILLLLLFLVIMFVRMTYFKKKGGMRKKF